jgi:hypothetical protein
MALPLAGFSFGSHPFFRLPEANDSIPESLYQWGVVIVCIGRTEVFIPVIPIFRRSYRPCSGEPPPDALPRGNLQLPNALTAMLLSQRTTAVCGLNRSKTAACLRL